MFRKNKKTAEKETSVRDSKHNISTTPVVSEVSITRVKNPVVIPDDYNPENKYGVDDRLLAYFYTKTEIDAMGGFPDWDKPDEKPLPFDDIIERIVALEKHSHSYDGDIIENDLPF